MHVALQERQLYFFMYQFIISICILGVLMMPAIVLVYIQLGQFLMSVMAFSWLYATFGFLSFCAVIGPVGNFGQLNITKYVQLLYLVEFYCSTVTVPTVRSRKVQYLDQIFNVEVVSVRVQCPPISAQAL